MNVNDDDNVKHFGITPRAVADRIKKDVEEFDSLFVVAVIDGAPLLYTSGSNADLAMAAMALFSYSQDSLFK